MSKIERPRNIVSNKLIKAIRYVKKWCPQLIKNGQWHHDMSKDAKLVSPNNHIYNQALLFSIVFFYMCVASFGGTISPHTSCLGHFIFNTMTLFFPLLYLMIDPQLIINLRLSSPFLQLSIITKNIYTYVFIKRMTRLLLTSFSRDHSFIL